MLLIFRSGASCQVRQFSTEDRDKNEYDGYKSECATGNSSDEAQAVLRHPYPLEETCLRDNDPSARIVCTNQHWQELEYKHVRNPMKLPCQ